MPDVTTLGTAISALGAWLDIFGSRKDRADATVAKVLLAVNETSSYIADWDQGHRNRDQERQLVRLWTNAAVAIRRHDRELADKLQMKAEYWADPDNWTAADVERAGIGIRGVTAKARSLLGGGL